MARFADVPAPQHWFPDPFGRYDYRLWSGVAWTDHVSDSGNTAIDRIEAITEVPTTIRPSWPALWARVRALPLWRKILAAFSPLFLALAFLPLYVWGGALLVEILGGFGILCLIGLPILYFNVVYVRADQTGIEVRNQLGFRKFLPRQRIGMITVGTTWAGGLTMPDFVFILSPSGQQLACFHLQNWNEADFSNIANALGLRVFGRPGRRLDERGGDCRGRASATRRPLTEGAGLSALWLNLQNDQMVRTACLDRDRCAVFNDLEAQRSAMFLGGSIDEHDR